MKLTKQPDLSLDDKSTKIEKTVFMILLAAMAVYYGYRLFAFTPWYDELYTYYCFISKGPIYAAIHWPLPNNHVGYSVLSACLDYLGNAYIGLRGVSYLCALANICILHRIAGKYMKGWMPLSTVILYISMNLVNQLAVQGRGYTMGITCFLTAWLCMICICEENKIAKKIYFIYAIALILGLYAVSSNVYWVVPLCLAGGVYLLVGGIRESREEKCFFLKTKKGKNLLKLIAASVIAAVGTIILYGTVWIAIGSNLLMKDEKSAYFGMGHIKIILSAPFAAVRRGMEYMLDTPYIQSEERAGFAGRLWDWLKTLSGYFYNSLYVAVMVIWGIGILFLGYKIINSIRKKEKANLLLYLVLFMGIVMVPVFLLIQCKRPYYRVFTYGGVFLAVLLGVLLDSVLKGISAKAADERIVKGISVSALILIVIFGVKCIVFSGYNEQYGIREHEIQDAFSHTDMDRWDNFCVTDCNQEYLFYFLYGIRCENREIEGADVVLLDKRMTDPDFDEMIWEFYHYYDTIPWTYIEQNMIPVFENDDYILFTRKDKLKERKNEK